MSVSAFFVILHTNCDEDNMKRYLFSIMMAATLLIGCATQQQRAERKEMMRKAVAEAVENRQMHIDIRSMNTLRYGSRTVTPDFYLELKGDTLRSYLPYLGQAYRAPMASPSEGLNFEARVLTIRESHPKKNLSRLEINVKTNEDSYFYSVELYDSGKAYILVRSQYRDPIGFDGELSDL